jgi:hypothetical protein
MDWLQPLPGDGMYIYFAIMGVCGLLVMIGYRYRSSLAALTLLWGGVYFMQKTVYNNHFYLLLLILVIMLFLPANTYAAIDSRKPQGKNNSMPAWCGRVMMLQVAIVYFFAAIAKFYPEWFDGSFTAIMLHRFGHTHHIALFEMPWFAVFIAYSGVAFDLLIVPLFLYRRTRSVALVAALLFHTFNWVVLKIGIFPFLALSFVIFFFPPETIRKLFFPKKPRFETATDDPIRKNNKNVLLFFFVPYFLIQLILPVRHWFIKGDVLWTEEGHRLSWRMMLRQRRGSVIFKVVNLKTAEEKQYDLNKSLTQRQLRGMATHPDMIWQMAQHIREEEAVKGDSVAIYVNAFCAINHRPKRRLIDPKVDLAHADWNYFGHSDWILLYN